jgi:hypothetical protein
MVKTLKLIETDMFRLTVASLLLPANSRRSVVRHSVSVDLLAYEPVSGLCTPPFVKGRMVWSACFSARWT